jgi:hypothetical protein
MRTSEYCWAKYDPIQIQISIIYFTLVSHDYTSSCGGALAKAIWYAEMPAKACAQELIEKREQETHSSKAKPRINDIGFSVLHDAEDAIAE